MAKSCGDGTAESTRVVCFFGGEFNPLCCFGACVAVECVCSKACVVGEPCIRWTKINDLVFFCHEVSSNLCWTTDGICTCGTGFFIVAYLNNSFAQFVARCRCECNGHLCIECYIAYRFSFRSDCSSHATNGYFDCTTFRSIDGDSVFRFSIGAPITSRSSKWIFGAGARNGVAVIVIRRNNQISCLVPNCCSIGAFAIEDHRVETSRNSGCIVITIAINSGHRNILCCCITSIVPYMYSECWFIPFPFARWLEINHLFAIGYKISLNAYVTNHLVCIWVGCRYGIVITIFPSDKTKTCICCCCEYYFCIGQLQCVTLSSGRYRTTYVC